MLDKGNNCAKAPLWFPVMITKKHKHILHSFLLFWAAGIRSPTKHVGFNLQDTQWLEFRCGWSRYHSFPYIRYLMSFSECKGVSERVNNSGLAKSVSLSLSDLWKVTAQSSGKPMQPIYDCFCSAYSRGLRPTSAFQLVGSGNSSSTPSTIAKRNGFVVTLLSACTFHAEVLHGLIYFPIQSLQTFISLLWYLLGIWVLWRNKAVIFCHTLAICFPFTSVSSCLISHWPLLSYSLPIKGGFTVT